MNMPREKKRFILRGGAGRNGEGDGEAAGREEAGMVEDEAGGREAMRVRGGWCGTGHGERRRNREGTGDGWAWRSEAGGTYVRTERDTICGWICVRAWVCGSVRLGVGGCWWL